MSARTDAKIAAMKCTALLAAAVVALLAGACGDSRAAATTGDGVLVLEVGGEAASLQAALRQAGFTPAAAVPRDATGVAPTDTGERGDASTPPVTPPPTLPPSPTPQPATTEPAWFTVTLADGQTPIHLARKHLGDGNRFREILDLNGWSENDARRLRAGQEVKIPRTAAAAIDGGTRR
jgi:nucleoid-associated protein YgaU